MRNVIRSYTDGLFDNKDKVKKCLFSISQSRLFAAALPGRTELTPTGTQARPGQYTCRTQAAARPSLLDADGPRPYRVALCLPLTPPEESVALGAAVFPGQGRQGVSSFHTS